MFVEKQLDLGNVHVGLKAKDQNITLKNQMRTTAVFDVVSKFEELEIKPMKGRVNGDSKQAFTVSFTSAKPMDF